MSLESPVSQSGKPVALGASSRQLLMLGIGLIFLAGTCIAIDLPVTRFLKSHELRGDIRRVVGFAEGFGHGLGVILMLAAVAALTRKWRQVVVLAVYAFGSGLLCDIAKVVVARHRPYNHVDLAGSVSDTVIVWFPWLNGVAMEQATTSFPSAHAGTAFGLAIGFARLYPHAAGLFVFFAVMAGFQRIESYAHFVSDVVFGAAIAAGYSALLARPWSVCSKLIAKDAEISSANESATVTSSGVKPTTTRRKCA